MWHGNFTIGFIEEAERIANNMRNERRVNTIAGYAAAAAIQRAKDKVNLSAEVKRQRDYPRILSANTLYKRERYGL